MVTKGNSEFIEIKGYKEPYVLFDNEPEKTDRPEVIELYLEKVIEKLWELYHRNHKDSF